MMFLFEAALLSFLATSIGAILGTVAAAILNASQIQLSDGFAVFLMNDTLRLVISPGSAIRAVMTITIVTTLFALYPAYRAARMRPVTAITHVG